MSEVDLCMIMNQSDNVKHVWHYHTNQKCQYDGPRLSNWVQIGFGGGPALVVLFHYCIGSKVQNAKKGENNTEKT